MKVKTAVFPVAGMGTRFLPATKVMPKEMLPVVDKPLIHYVVEEALAAGIEKLVFVTGRGKGALEDHFDISYELEDTLEKRGKSGPLAAMKEMLLEAGALLYTRQQEPLGLGHAVWCAREVVGDDPFAVLLPDDFIHGKTPAIAQMAAAFEENPVPMAAVMEVPGEAIGKYGVLDPAPDADTAARLVKARGMVEKPDPAAAPSNLAIIGRYVLTPRIFDFLAEGVRGAGNEIQLTDAMLRLLDEEAFHGFRFEGTRYDCGDKAGFQMANLAVALSRPDLRAQLAPFVKEAASGL